MKKLLHLFSLCALILSAVPADAQVGRESTNFSQWKLATNAADFLTRMGATNLLRLLTNDASALTNIIIGDTNAGNLLLRSNNLSDVDNVARAQTNLGVQRIVAGTNLVAQTNGVNVTLDIRNGASPLLTTTVVSNWMNIPVGVSNLHPVRVDQLASNTNAIVTLLFTVNAADSNAWRAADTAISNAIATISNLFRTGDTAISNNFWSSNVAIINQVLVVSNQMRTADTALSNSITSASNNLQTQINGALAATNGAGTGNTLTNLTIKKPLVIDYASGGSPYVLVTNSNNGSSFYLWDTGTTGNTYIGDLTSSGVFVGSLGVIPFGGGENLGQENGPWKQITARRIQFMPVATDSASAIYLSLTNRVHTITLTNNVTFHTTNRIGGVTLESYAIITASEGDRTIAVNSGWGKLNDLSAITLTNGTRAILSLVCTGDSETNVIAAYAPIQ